jgi:hypothetical protein
MGLFDRPDYLGAPQPVQSNLYGATSPRDVGKYHYGAINKDLYNRPAMGYVTGDIHVPLPGPAPAPYGTPTRQYKSFQKTLEGVQKFCPAIPSLESLDYVPAGLSDPALCDYAQTHTWDPSRKAWRKKGVDGNGANGQNGSNGKGSGAFTLPTWGYGLLLAAATYGIWSAFKPK